MEVILVESIHGLGSFGETVKVKAGFARNHLVPKGKAVFVTAENLAKFEARRAEFAQQEAQKLELANQRAAQLNALKVTISATVSEEGKLYGSLGAREIADAITAQGVEVERRELSLPDGVIRFIGQYEIHVHLHSEVNAIVHLEVVSES